MSGEYAIVLTHAERDAIVRIVAKWSEVAPIADDDPLMTVVTKVTGTVDDPTPRGAA